MLRWLLGGYPPRTVDSVLAGFNKTLQQLETIEKETEQTSKANYLLAQNLMAQACEQHIESLRASKVSLKIKALIE